MIVSINFNNVQDKQSLKKKITVFLIAQLTENVTTTQIVGLTVRKDERAFDPKVTL